VKDESTILYRAEARPKRLILSLSKGCVALVLLYATSLIGGGHWSLVGLILFFAFYIHRIVKASREGKLAYIQLSEKEIKGRVPCNLLNWNHRQDLAIPLENIDFQKSRLNPPGWKNFGMWTLDIYSVDKEMLTGSSEGFPPEELKELWERLRRTQ